MNDCLFCKIVKGDVPSANVHEDDEVLAFLDINPVNPGHVLVIPKKHFSSFHETPDEVLAKLIVVAKKIALALRKTGVEGVNIGINNGALAGQVIFHTHIHVMPRTKDDGYRLWHGKPYGEGEMEKMAEKIRGAL